MPWVFVNNRRRSTNTRRRSNGYASARPDWDNPYADDDFENDPAYQQDDFDDYGDPEDPDDMPVRGRRPGRRRARNRADNGNWDGAMYDRDGNRISLTISTPRDMLPPQRPGAEVRYSDAPIRTRARF